MKLTTPITHDGEVFTDLALSLAVNLRVTEDGGDDVTIALRVVPSRIAPASVELDGNAIPAHVVAADGLEFNQVIGRISEASPDGLVAIQQVRATIEQYLRTLGL
jgi:predicted aspartyl protease